MVHFCWSHIHYRDRELLRELELLPDMVARESRAGLAYWAGEGDPINLLGEAMLAAAAFAGVVI